VINRLKGNWLVVLLLLMVLALGVAAAGKLSARPVQAAGVGVTFTCTPDLIVSANVRVVGHCPSTYNDAGSLISWFAFPTSDSANASRMLSLLETARATNTTVTFYFITGDTSGTAYGCLAGDCRAFWAVTSP
jgi:hypothetical protein